MPRYLIEPMAVIDGHAAEDMSWIHSYSTRDRDGAFCACVATVGLATGQPHAHPETTTSAETQRLLSESTAARLATVGYACRPRETKAGGLVSGGALSACPPLPGDFQAGAAISGLSIRRTPKQPGFSRQGVADSRRLPH